jgi:hypothetical protein
MNLSKMLKGAVRVVKNNPEIALMVAGAVAPKVVAKAAPKIAKAVAAVKVVKAL